MATFYYTDQHNFEDSSVLSYAYFCEDSDHLYGDLVVILHSGVKAGYEKVPRLVYDSLVNADSAGSYWNRFIKYQFLGFDTDYITDFERVDETGFSDVTADDFRDALGTWNPDDVDDNTKAEEVTPASAKVRYTVALDLDNDEDGEVTVFASDDNDAVSRVKSALVILGWDAYEVLSLTRYFD